MTAVDPLHANARATLVSWRPPDPEQGDLREDYLRHLDRYGDAVRRDCRSGHLTASALIVDPHRECVLLTLHAVIGRWLQTGGHCEPEDSTLVAAALREAREEGGIDAISIEAEPLRLDRHRVLCRDDRRGDGHADPLDHLDVQFLAIAPRDARARLSAESLDLRWWPWGQLPPVDDSVHSLVRAARIRLGDID